MKIQRYDFNSICAFADNDGPYVRYSDVQPFLEPRPISEAPKDGTIVLVFGGYWAGEVTGTSFTEEGWSLVSWTETGWRIQGTDQYSTWIYEPTHFLPLPPVGEQG